MSQILEQEVVALAASLLDIMPRLNRRIHADVPLVEGETEGEGKEYAELSELRATPGQLALLQVLVEHDRCTMQELAGHLGVVPSTVTAMVKRLLTQGYIQRSRDDVDWRTVWVQPSERGRQIMDVYNRARCAALRRRLEQLNEEELKQLCVALPAIRHLYEV